MLGTIGFIFVGALIIDTASVAYRFYGMYRENMKAKKLKQE